MDYMDHMDHMDHGGIRPLVIAELILLKQQRGTQGAQERLHSRIDTTAGLGDEAYPHAQ